MADGLPFALPRRDLSKSGRATDGSSDLGGGAGARLGMCYPMLAGVSPVSRS